ncbi:MAG: hypothetical protein R2788_25760 [Saprospiraceae bacterium]
MSRYYSIIAVKKGRQLHKAMVAAHLDEISFIVTHIDDDGFIRIHTLGGFDPNANSHSGNCSWEKDGL